MCFHTVIQKENKQTRTKANDWHPSLRYICCGSLEEPSSSSSSVPTKTSVPIFPEKGQEKTLVLVVYFMSSRWRPVDWLSRHVTQLCFAAQFTSRPKHRYSCKSVLQMSLLLSPRTKMIYLAFGRLFHSSTTGEIQKPIFRSSVSRCVSL